MTMNSSNNLPMANLMLICTPDTEKRVWAIKNELVANLQQEVEFQKVDFKKFMDTSWNPKLLESVRDKHVYFYFDYESNYDDWTVNADVNSRYMFMRWILDTLARFGAKTINLIVPMFPFSRSDKAEKIWILNTQSRKPLYAPMVMQDLKWHGVDYVFTIDIHDTSIFSAYGANRRDPKWINIPHGWVIQEWLKKHGIYIPWEKLNFVIWSTDEWGTSKMKLVANDMWINNYFAFKARDFTVANKVDKLFISPGFAEIEGRDVVIYDDMIDTWWTLVKAIAEVWKFKPKSVTVVSTHWMFNGDAKAKLQNLYDEKKLEAIYITDSVYREDLPEFVKVLDTSSIFARQIARKYLGKSLDPNWSGYENDIQHN